MRWKKNATNLILIIFLLFVTLHGLGLVSGESHNQRALAKLKSFDFSGAIVDFRAALDADPESLALRVNLALAHFYAGDFQHASRHLEDVLQEEPCEPYALYLSAVIADREGHCSKAAELFRKVLESVPGDSGSYYYLGLIALREEQTQKAVDLFKKALVGNPGCTSSLYNLGRALIAIGKTEEGEAVLKRFQALQSEKEPGLGGGMGDPSVLVGTFGQPRALPENRGGRRE